MYSHARRKKTKSPSKISDFSFSTCKNCMRGLATLTFFHGSKTNTETPPREAVTQADCQKIPLWRRARFTASSFHCAINKSKTEPKNSQISQTWMEAFEPRAVKNLKGKFESVCVCVCARLDTETLTGPRKRRGQAKRSGDSEGLQC